MTQELKLTSPSTASRETLMALGALLAVLALLAFLPIMIKLSEYEISPNAIALHSSWIDAMALGLWNGLWLLKRQWFGNPPPVKQFSNIYNLLLLVTIMAMFSASHLVLYSWSLTQTSVANSEVLHSLTPLFIAFVGWTFLGLRFEHQFLIGIVIATGGSIALAVNDFSLTTDKLQGDGLALVSAIFGGAYLLVLEKLQTQLSATAITTWNYLLGTVFLLPIVLGSGDGLFPHSWRVWLMVAAIATVGIFTTFLITYSLKRLSSGLVATILLLHPAITAILAWGIFSETLGWLNLLAFVVILLGVYLATSSKGGVKATQEENLPSLVDGSTTEPIASDSAAS
jgi:drug/metabolite transporter (DMT)-like permease